MKSKALIALALCLASTAALADLDKIIPATRYDVKVERAERIAGDHHLQGQVNAQGDRLEKTNDRVDAVAYTTNSNTARLGKVESVNKAQDARLDKTNQRVDAVAWTTNSNTTRVGKLEGRADDTDLVLINHSKQLNQQGNRLDGHDQQFADQAVVNAAIGSSLAGLYQDTAALSGQVKAAHEEARQARREAKDAQKYAAVALAVAGHQFNTEPSAGFQMALSGSTIGGNQAVAIGMGGAINEKWFVNAAAATSGGETGGVVSTTYSLGR